ncbi:MAG: hypothetical protein JWL61_5029 [Gemmatimonadetes bacterium]|nr:hypothetical protein [Gemmatimonadota bacterium]
MSFSELLKSAEMTTYEVAQAVKALGVSDQAVYRLARVDGAVQRLDLRLAAALCQVLGVEPSALLTNAPVPRKPAKK